ncbi:MAG: hypothetical protein OEU92_01980, partial [Alphaproteobacteria bacterium]|nr:hypothetical protein [Alphaproteobacteria bacterium]
YTTEEWLGERRADAEKLLGALVRASRFAHDEPAQAKRLVESWLGFDQAFIDYLWPKHRLTVTLSQDLLRIMEDEAEWRIDNGLSNAAEIPNYLMMVDSGPLAAIDPAAVTIFGRIKPALGTPLQVEEANQ